MVRYVNAKTQTRRTVGSSSDDIHTPGIVQQRSQGLSDHFSRQFKAATGLPPHQFLITRRVERAQQILRGRGGLSLAEVAIGVADRAVSPLSGQHEAFG